MLGILLVSFSPSSEDCICVCVRFIVCISSVGLVSTCSPILLDCLPICSKTILNNTWLSRHSGIVKWQVPSIWCRFDDFNSSFQSIQLGVLYIEVSTIFQLGLWSSFSYLLTNFSIHNPINGFRPVLTYSSRGLCFLCTYAVLSHQSMTGIVILFADFRRTTHLMTISPEHPPPFEWISVPA